MTFEGIDGAGKSTLIQGLQRRLTAQGVTVCVTREPGAGTVGSAIRSLLLDGESLPPETELFLFLADRSQHVQSVIRPALARGETVLCDRFADSTLVYQGYGRGFDLASLRSWNTFATGDLVPDLTFLLDLSIQDAGARTTKGDRLDQESVAFRSRIREGFLEEASNNPARWTILDATLAPDLLEEGAWGELRRRQL